MAISMLKIRRPLGRLIFNMGIAIPGKTVFLIETAPRLFTEANEKCVLICTEENFRANSHFIIVYLHTKNIKNRFREQLKLI